MTRRRLLRSPATIWFDVSEAEQHGHEKHRAHRLPHQAAEFLAFAQVPPNEHLEAAVERDDANDRYVLTLVAVALIEPRIRHGRDDIVGFGDDARR